MVKNNSLPPASQPWVRELEKRIKDLERETSSTHARVSHLKNVTSSPKMNLDSLTVGELKVGGDPIVVPFLTGAGIMGWSVSGGTVEGSLISSTGGPVTVSATMPDLDIEGGFVMEWALEASATVDYISVTNSIEAPAEEAEPNAAMADEFNTYYASAGYNLGEDEEYVPEPDEDVRPPVPVMVSFTFTNPEPGPFTVEIISSNASYTILGQGGVQVTAEGEVLIVGSDGESHQLRELTEAEAQAIVETADNLKQAQVELAKANTLLTTLGVAEDEAAITQALADFLDIPASEVTWSGNLYQAVLARLVVATGIVTETMIATGAITAPKLNVTYTDPESGYGFSLQPEGLTILDESGSPVIALRADMANYFTIMRDGAVVASISPHGDIAGRSVSAADSLRYKGEEMSALLGIPARGVLARSTNFGQSIADVGTSAGRIAAVSLTTPSSNRNIRISFEGRIAGGNDPKKTLFHIRQADTPYVRPTNSSVKDWYVETDGNDDFTLSFTTTVDELTWPYGTQISVGVFAQSQVAGDVIKFHRSGHQQLVIEDLGPAVAVQAHPAYVPAAGGGVPTGNIDEHLWREQTSQKEASWVQTYRPDGTKYVYMSSVSDWAQRRAYQGYNDATSGVIGFPSMVSELSGATIKRVRLWIKNTATSLPEGATARISLHGYTSKPATHSWASDVPIMEVPFSRSESQAIDIPAQYHAGVQSGLYRGVVFSASGMGTQYAGVWDGENALWEIIYEK